MTPVFFDLDDTLLDDIGAQAVYLAQLHAAWRAHLPHPDAAAFCTAWRAALDHHFERHLRGELSFVEQRRQRIRDVFQAPLSDDDCDARTREFLAAYEANWRLFDDVIPRSTRWRIARSASSPTGWSRSSATSSRARALSIGSE